MEKREIKFRAFCDADGENTRMIYFGMQECDNGIFAWPMPNNIQHIDEYHSPLMQCAAVKDKNGRVIYEGDIVKDDRGIGVVYYYAPSFIAQCPADEESNDGVYSLAKGHVNVTQLEETEVIGNIYENPDLIA